MCNTQPFLFTVSGLLSQATGPNNVGFAKPPTQTDQPQQARRIRICNVRVVYGDATGEVQVFDNTTATPGPDDEVWGSVAPSAVGGVDPGSEVCFVCNSGDVYVKITGAGVKAYLYVDKEI